MGYLADIQFVDVAAGASRYIAAAIEIADDIMELAETAEVQSRGSATNNGKSFINDPL